MMTSLGRVWVAMHWGGGIGGEGHVHRWVIFGHGRLQRGYQHPHVDIFAERWRRGGHIHRYQ